MRDPVAYYPVRDFSTIRICCHHEGCFAVTELDLHKVEDVMKKTAGCCPICGKPFNKPGVGDGKDVATAVANAVLALNELAPLVGLEFPVVVK